MAANSQFSSTPVSVIYAQNWPVPTSNSFSHRYKTKPDSNSQKKNPCNSPWICKPKEQAKRPQKYSSPTVRKSYSWASSMLTNNYPEWLESDPSDMLDMAKEYKMTLQMFRKLTDQVKEVDEQLHSYKQPYSFKHYFSKQKQNKSNSKWRTYTPEIPMTNEEYQPCNNLSFKRDEQRQPSQFRTDRKMNKFQTNTSKSKANHEIWSLPNTRERKWKQQESLSDQNDNKNHSARFQNETAPKISDNDDTFWSGFLEFSDEDNHVGSGYINPVPEDWEARKMQELELEHCSDEDGSHNDPFMLRYLQLCRLETETILQEKGNGPTANPNSVANLESGVSKVTIADSKGGKRTSSSKKTASKTNGMFENSERNQRRVVKKSSTSSLQDFEKYCNEKEAKNPNKESQGSCKEKKTKQDKVQNRNKRTECKSAKGKRRVQSCKVRPCSTYSSSVTYNILELASTFSPPGKERMKVNPRPVTAKSAKSKGMIPGKTWSSQRRFSLTAGQSLQSVPSDNSDAVVRKSRSSSAKKSSKRTTKRCSSSKF